MTNDSTNLNCSFLSGSDDFLYLGPYDKLKVEQAVQENTVITTHVSMVTGSYIISGHAKLNNNIVTLIYESIDNGSICFERYSCEISFTIPTASLPSDTIYKLQNNHESKVPENEFDELL